MQTMTVPRPGAIRNKGSPMAVCQSNVPRCQPPPQRKPGPPCLALEMVCQLEGRLEGEGVLIRPTRHFRRLSAYSQD